MPWSWASIVVGPMYTWVAPSALSGATLTWVSVPAPTPRPQHLRLSMTPIVVAAVSKSKKPNPYLRKRVSFLMEGALFWCNKEYDT